jgi:hypothetical protein
MSIKLVDPVITGCVACDDGCMCAGGTSGCEHFGCWGTHPTGTCPSAAVHRAAWREVNPGMFSEPDVTGTWSAPVLV